MSSRVYGLENDQFFDSVTRGDNSFLTTTFDLRLRKLNLWHNAAKAQEAAAAPSAPRPAAESKLKPK